MVSLCAYSKNQMDALGYTMNEQPHPNDGKIFEFCEYT